MQLKDLKKQVNDSIKNISNLIHKEQKKKIKLIFILLLLTVFTILTILFFQNISGLFSRYAEKKFTTSKSNPILQKANEAFEKGLLENSAIYYQTYLNSNISNSEKILTLKRLFEISILRNDFIEALDYLDKRENLDKKNFETPIDRIKVLLRIGYYEKAAKEIQKNQRRYKNSTEFKELVGVHHLIVNDYKKAIEAFEKIPFNKREYSTHKKLIFSYISNNEFDKALKYIEKISGKIKLLDERKYFSEIVLLKTITKILLNKFDDANDDIAKLSVKLDYTGNKDILLNLQIFLNIYLNKTDEIEKITNANQDFIKQDKDILNLLADFFYYNKKYDMAIDTLDKMESLQSLAEDDILILAASNYMIKNYTKSISYLELALKNFNIKSPGIYKNLSLSYGKHGNFQNEIFFLKQGLSLFPQEIDFYIRLANVYISNSDWNRALDYVKQAKEIYKQNKNIPYDNRIDLLYVACLNFSNKKSAEKELLLLREKESSNPDFYFNIIKYYINEHKYSDAKRETESVEKLSLNNEQKLDLLNYKLILFTYFSDAENLKKTKKELASTPDKRSVDKINSAVTEIFDGNYERAINILETTDTTYLDTNFKNKIFYLKSVSYYYKRNYPISLKLVQLVLEQNPNDKKAIYLRNLINNKYKESE